MKLAIQFTKAVLRKLFCGSAILYVCAVLWLLWPQVSCKASCWISESSFFNVKIENFLVKCCFLLSLSSISHSKSPSLSHTKFMRYSHLPRREFHTVNCGETDFKCVLNTDCAVVVSLSFLFSHVQLNKRSCQAPTALQRLVFSFYATSIRLDMIFFFFFWGGGVLKYSCRTKCSNNHMFLKPWDIIIFAKFQSKVRI